MSLDSVQSCQTTLQVLDRGKHQSLDSAQRNDCVKIAFKLFKILHCSVISYASNKLSKLYSTAFMIHRINQPKLLRRSSCHKLDSGNQLQTSNYDKSIVILVLRITTKLTSYLMLVGMTAETGAVMSPARVSKLEPTEAFRKSSRSYDIFRPGVSK